MVIGERLREIRQLKSLTQGDIEKRTGLLRCYLSRVENGHTVPSLDTLEKIARALEVPLYQIFYEGNGSPKPLIGNEKKRGLSKRDSRMASQLAELLARMKETDKRLLLGMARKLSAAG